MSLPDDIIEKILQERHVYVAIRYMPNYELSSWKCIGIFNTIKQAKTTIIKDMIDKLVTFDVYDPAKRFEERNSDVFQTNKRYWVDRWDGNCCFTYLFFFMLSEKSCKI